MSLAVLSLFFLRVVEDHSNRECTGGTVIGLFAPDPEPETVTAIFEIKAYKSDYEDLFMEPAECFDWVGILEETPPDTKLLIPAEKQRERHRARRDAAPRLRISCRTRIEER